MIDQYKKEASEAIDEFLLASADRMDDFKDWKDEALDWSWDSIMEDNR